MASLLYQTIEQISREKHIEPDVIVAAIGRYGGGREKILQD